MANQSRIKQIIIHYTATYEDQAVSREEIRQWHLARGFADIGYHFVIHQDGRIEVGRQLHVVGAHAPPNTGRVGISYIGGLRRSSGPNVGLDTRTPQQTQAMITLIRELLTGRRDTSKVTVDPNAQVLGHRDVGQTQCPGFDVAPWWRSVVLGTAVPAPPLPRPDVTPPPVRTPGVREDSDGTGNLEGALPVAVGGIAMIFASMGMIALWAGLAAVAIAVGYVLFRYRKSIRSTIRRLRGKS